MKKQTFKIHISSRTYHPVGLSGGAEKTQVKTKRKSQNLLRLVFNLFFNLFFQIGSGVIHFCYLVGSAVVHACTLAVRSLLNHLQAHRKRAADYGSLIASRQFQVSLAVFLFLAVSSFLALKSARIVALGLELKRKVVGIASEGADHLLEAQKLVEAKDIDAAQSQFILALQSFKTGKDQFEQTNKLLKQGLDLLPQKRDADRLLSAASYISKSGVEMVAFYNDVEQLKISPAGLTTDGSVKDIMADMSTQLGGALSDLQVANEKLNAVNSSSLPNNYAATFGEIKSRLAILQKSLRNLQDLFTITENIALGRKKILFLFENNNELRAAGGFIGTYGDAEVQDGAIMKLTVSSIYDLDGQLTDKILPPTPLLNVSDRWYMRDSNWFANFPDSAKKVSGFYEKEGGETPDMVIALTPSLITDLLKITGPIDMPRYKTTLTADNFVEMTQVETSVDYDKQSNTPKQMLADFFPILLQHIAALDAGGMEQAVLALQKNLNGKQLVFYSRDLGLEQELQEFNWTGTLSDTDRDYLSVVNSNLGGTKTDLSIQQTVSLETTIGDDGAIVNHLTITRKNPLPKLDETPNTSFIRVYVPQGSQLISNTGFDYMNLDASAFKGYKKDPAVLDWEKSAVKDVTTGTLIGQESGKTYFGNWLTVNGGETRTVELTYKLPFSLDTLDHFSLMLQKQIGSTDSNFEYRLHFGNRALDWENINTNNLDGNSISENISVDKDYFLGFVLHKQ